MVTERDVLEDKRRLRDCLESLVAMEERLLAKQAGVGE